MEKGHERCGKWSRRKKHMYEEVVGRDGCSEEIEDVHKILIGRKIGIK